MTSMQPQVRTAFVMEQALGHVTHAANLASQLAERADIAPTWLPIPFEVRGAARLVPLLRSNWSVRASWRARKALNDALARKPLDALVFHTQVTSLFSVSLMRRIPSLISLDATPINYDSVGAYYGHRAASTGFLDRRKFEMNKVVFQAASVLVTWSDWARKSLIHDYAADPTKIHVLAPGAGRAYFDIADRRQPSGDSNVRVLFVGGDFERKGGPLLLEAIRDLPIHLDVVTSRSVTAPSNVAVHTNVVSNSRQLLDLFARADVFILPSYAECLAVALMEASAAGLPVITTNVGALSEGVVPGVSGFVIAPGDVKSLRQALNSLINDQDRRQQMGRSANELARRKFDADLNNQALLDLVVAQATIHNHVRRAA